MEKYDWTQFNKYKESSEFEFDLGCQNFRHALTLPYRHASTHPHTDTLSYLNILTFVGVTHLHSTYLPHVFTCALTEMCLRLHHLYLEQKLRSLSQFPAISHNGRHHYILCFHMKKKISRWQLLLGGKVTDESVQTEAFCKNLTFAATDEEWKDTVGRVVGGSNCFAPEEGAISGKQWSLGPATTKLFK